MPAFLRDMTTSERWYDMKKGRWGGKGGKGMKSSEDGNLMSVDQREEEKERVEEKWGEEKDFISLRMITAEETLYDLRCIATVVDSDVTWWM